MTEREQNSQRKTVVVRFSVPGQMARFDSGGVDYQLHDEVVVDSERGTRVGVIIQPPVDDDGPQAPPILRLADDNDRRIVSLQQDGILQEGVEQTRDQIRGEPTPSPMAEQDLLRFHPGDGTTGIQD